MDFAHLPVAGGIYDQHPQLIKEWSIIFNMKNAKDEAKHRQTLSKQEAMLANARNPKNT